MDLVNPSRLKSGDKVATISLSWGGAGMMMFYGDIIRNNPNNMNFGHTSPMITIPYGAIGEIDCGNKTFCILNNAVIYLI